jgi:oxygen-independent coproporphyrinogen-3 oxidase
MPIVLDRPSGAPDACAADARPRHVYVHVPFCGRRCAYCDFAIAVRRDVPVDEYVGALAAELGARFGAADPWLVDTLYFGGGTPSRLGADGVRRTMELLRTRLSLAPDAEVTLEANPEDVSPAAVAAWRDAGINRLSIGGQSFDDGVLAWMRRAHTGDAIERAVDVARAGGIENFSFDLIFALTPGVARDWAPILRRMLAIAPPHVSLYGLTIEPGDAARAAARARHAGRDPRGALRGGVPRRARGARRGRLRPLRGLELRAAGLPLAPQLQLLARRGLRRPRPLGPRLRRPRAPLERGALRRVGAPRRGGADPVAGAETLTDENRTAELVYLGLRTQLGVVLTRSELPHVAPWVEAGWAVLDGARLRLTALGWLRLDSLAASLTHIRSRS